MFICDECVELCSDIIAQEHGKIHHENLYPRIFGVEIPQQFHNGTEALSGQELVNRVPELVNCTPDALQKALGQELLRAHAQAIIPIVERDISEQEKEVERLTLLLTEKNNTSLDAEATMQSQVKAFKIALGTGRFDAQERKQVQGSLRALENCLLVMEMSRAASLRLRNFRQYQLKIESLK